MTALGRYSPMRKGGAAPLAPFHSVRELAAEFKVSQYALAAWLAADPDAPAPSTSIRSAYATCRWYDVKAARNWWWAREVRHKEVHNMLTATMAARGVRVSDVAKAVGLLHSDVSKFIAEYRRGTAEMLCRLEDWAMENGYGQGD